MLLKSEVYLTRPTKLHDASLHAHPHPCIHLPTLFLCGVTSVKVSKAFKQMAVSGLKLKTPGSKSFSDSALKSVKELQISNWDAEMF